MDTVLNTHQRLAKLRLTRRGRLVAQLLGAFCLVVLVAAASAAASPQQSAPSAVASDEVNQETYEQIVVQPGDTLWGISARLSQDEDQGVILNQILTYNDLDSSDLEVGATLYVPVVE